MNDRQRSPRGGPGGRDGQRDRGGRRGRSGQSSRGRPTGSGGTDRRDQPGSDRRPDRSHDRSRETPRDRVPSAPPIDDDVTGKEIDKSVRQELSTLDGPVAGTVARHLVMAGRLMDTDPDLAHEHAQHARKRAGRVAVVREAAGYAAYNAGHFDVALKEFQAARRISGRADFIAVLADCERGVGRPEKAVALLDDPVVASLPADAAAELAIVAAGALRDLDRTSDALELLRRAMPARLPREQWVARLQYALGDVLAVLGRTDEAVSAFAAAEAGDIEGDLDAGGRVVELLDG